jgi:hypothetical protein
MLFKLGNISLHFKLFDLEIIQPAGTPLTKMSLGVFNDSLLQQFGTGYLKTESKGNRPVYPTLTLYVLHVREIHGFRLNTTALKVPLSKCSTPCTAFTKLSRILKYGLGVRPLLSNQKATLILYMTTGLMTLYTHP